MTKKSATYIQNTKNSKLSKFEHGIDATYASIKSSCSNACPWFDSGCYAQSGKVSIVLSRLNNETTSLQVAKDEAKAIDESWGGGKVPKEQVLRLHIAGDCQTNVDAKTLAKSVSSWIKRGGSKAYSYTHSWRKIKKESWGKISILASVESFSDAAKALKKNYAPAIIVSKFENKKAFIKNNIKFIPCPAQTFEKITCLDCRLCFDAEKLVLRSSGIAFEAHGISSNKVKNKLKVIQQL